MVHMPFMLCMQQQHMPLQVRHIALKVINRAIELTLIDFTVIEGLSAKKRQAQLLKEEKIATQNTD
ncbi:hypothetical protein HMPREF0016_03189 [Acinetobacter johnsonii SH046]|uniref:Uncharacterized protein n=2 Tax=Moraxellaceae TaxID=468 RepID=D0SH66_ACIJO|nr:hypothetical protein HMPREF0016_03189 [Acinetobacter johnsonii SH046]ENX59845.1 hypothetical protein F884_02973 [Acinetobacter sp. CIP 102143]